VYDSEKCVCKWGGMRMWVEMQKMQNVVVREKKRKKGVAMQNVRKECINSNS